MDMHTVRPDHPGTFASRTTLAGRAPLPVGSDGISRARFFHDVITEWLADPGITLACGRWDEGAITENLPLGRATLLPQKYSGAFSGVREIRMANGRDHVHLDLFRIHAISYVIAPSVCYDFKPSFEGRLLTATSDGSPSEGWLLTFMVTRPYLLGRLNRPEVERFLSRALTHHRLAPELTRLDIDPRAVDRADIRSVLKHYPSLRKPGRPTVRTNLRAGDLPATQREYPAGMVRLLREALLFRGASLVIHRESTLVEFKTEQLEAVFEDVHAGRVSWQIGAGERHHCHLEFDRVHHIHFAAQPSPCQRGALNYSIWFMVPGFSGNPSVPGGYFSIVLDSPYLDGKPRHDLIEQLFDLYAANAHEAWVSANDTFIGCLKNGPPDVPHSQDRLQEL